MAPKILMLDNPLSAMDIARELALVKVIGTGEQRVEAMRIADTFRAHVVDTTLGSFVLTGG